MDSILDTSPYPWHLPDAMALFTALYQNISRPQRALLLAGTAGLDVFRINQDQASYDVWPEILNLAATSRKTRALVEAVRADPSLNTIHPLLDSLLADRPLVVDREPCGSQGEPRFLRKDDTITEPEALLFHDDLTISAGRIPWLIQVLAQVHKLSASVCRLEVSRDALSQSGTGFRIGEDLILTNWHVLSLNGGQPKSVVADFGYDTDLSGVPTAATQFICETASIQTNQQDDWGIIRARHELPPSIPVIDIADLAADPLVQKPTFIVQHPLGGRKRLAYVRNQITFFDDVVVQYITDTQVGSSGSPVFDEDGRIVALHHAGGRPQEVAGRQPIKKNEGIRISRVLAGLKSAGVIS